MYRHIQIPAEGAAITVNADNTLNVPVNPIIPFIEGDGTGGADDSWRDLDRDDEWAYQQSLGSNPAN